MGRKYFLLSFCITLCIIVVLSLCWKPRPAHHSSIFVPDTDGIDGMELWCFSEEWGHQRRVDIVNSNEWFFEAYINAGDKYYAPSSNPSDYMFVGISNNDNYISDFMLMCKSDPIGLLYTVECSECKKPHAYLVCTQADWHSDYTWGGKISDSPALDSDSVFTTNVLSVNPYFHHTSRMVYPGCYAVWDGDTFLGLNPWWYDEEETKPGNKAELFYPGGIKP